ncbi:DEAD/DEAH box helicase family protein [Lysobacter sp. N42]|uniref:DEAD/DEAH box helicase family protein n=1 Tax=Lysobacter sp. N42 TaxID=2545719 RepID=UPI001051884E|nr:DEAD/DEAH box helicase family protein [Lysobacter sp. N42]TCZ84256.1 restriction endonuclease subunit R [Lysobacter sp. N42]
MTAVDDPLILAKALTKRTEQLCAGLDAGTADVLELVTPVTAELLRWWFGDDARQTRRFNFHAGQRQAILNTIVAHEVLGSHDVKNLYEQVCPDALLTGTRLAEVSQAKHAHPKYALKMATGTGKTWVLQALLVWQVLNRTVLLEEGVDDPRFSRRFLIVAPGLIVYERLLDAFLGKEREGGGGRDFSTSDTERYAELFVPPAWRERVRQFVQGNFCAKQDIGLKATGNGLIAVTNWHLLQETGDELAEAEAEDAALEAPGIVSDPHEVVRHVLPVVPGRATGNSLDVLDTRWARGRVIAFLQSLPDLVVFNDEAHHIHELRRDGEADEVEWQKSLSRIAEGKGRRFVQVDFSATPYNERPGRGRGAGSTKVWFPHIVVDFDLKSAMRAGLVKSLVLDKRREIGAIPLEALDFKAERDEDGTLRLSDGQRVMLRAGLHKLRRLEKDFAALDPNRHPKMLVVCEDTAVSPLVAQFLEDEGLHADDVLTVDSGRKAELGEKDWAPLRQRLFDVDRHAQPRVIVSVLMLREGFDVNNICVIVPLRASGAQILLEQTIGRGLRLMWREPEFDDIKRENRERIDRGEEPGSLIDILSIVEHPRFEAFYEELMRDGLVGSSSHGDDEGGAIGDMINVELREGWEAFDFRIPFILREVDESIDHLPIDLQALPAFSQMSRTALAGLLGKGDTFVSQDLQSSTLFGDYRVEGSVMNVSGYNEYLSRLTRRVAQALSSPLPRGNRVAEHLATPYMQVNTTVLAQALDDYIRERLFAESFEPLVDEGWRLLLLQPVIDHIVRVFGLALVNSEERGTAGETEVRHRRLSEVDRIPLRESTSMDVTKCIYPRQGWPARSGGLERGFIEWCQADAGVEAFCKLSESRHEFARLRYVREDGLPAFYFPDFMVRTADSIYLVETKAQEQTGHPNVQRKRRAAATWCSRINGLPPYDRDGREWHYALVGESLFEDWRRKGARLADLLAFSRVRPAPDPSTQSDLFRA